MENLINANTFEDAQRYMIDKEVMKDIKIRFPNLNPKIIATMYLIKNFPLEINIALGSPLHSSALDSIGNLTEETYKEFEVQLKKHLEQDANAMVQEINNAQELMETTMKNTPPEKEYFSEWKRGTEFHISLLEIAKQFLETRLPAYKSD